MNQVLNEFRVAPTSNNGDHAPSPNDDIKSVNLSELNDYDRISDISSLAESDLQRKHPLSRPKLGLRPPHREAFINKLNSRRQRKKTSDSGLVLDI